MSAARMKKRSKTNWARIDAQTDKDIDTSDIPPLGKEFFQRAELWMPKRKARVTLRMDTDVLDWFKRKGRGYQTRINAVLRMFVAAQKQNKG